jgi:hypothetical protein
VRSTPLINGIISGIKDGWIISWSRVWQGYHPDNALEHPSGKLWNGVPREESRGDKEPLGKMPCTKSEIRYIYTGKKDFEDS